MRRDPGASLPTGLDVVRAVSQLRQVSVRTPLVSCPSLDRTVGTPILSKVEALQRTGSFKFRGAYWSAVNHPRRAGLVAASSGNHAQAVALTAHLLGLRSVVVIPNDAPAEKVEGCWRLGAELVRYDRERDDRDEIVRRIVATERLLAIPSANDRFVIAGNGTVALEVLEEREVHAVVVPIGGGGLAAGTVLAARAIAPAVRVVGVEPATANDCQLSLHLGRIITRRPGPTLADGLRHSAPSPLPYDVINGMIDEVVTVSDDEIVEAMVLAYQHLRIAVEPSGAVALAAIIAGRVPAGTKPTCAILTGGNVGRMRHPANPPPMPLTTREAQGDCPAVGNAVPI